MCCKQHVLSFFTEPQQGWKVPMTESHRAFGSWELQRSWKWANLCFTVKPLQHPLGCPCSKSTLTIKKRWSSSVGARRTVGLCTTTVQHFPANARRKTHRGVRVIGHNGGYDGSLNSVGSNHASVQGLSEHRREVIHVLQGQDWKK